ncbi:DUF1905 domain-containing protein [Hoeflea sp.]|uniref:DUF1905 domain-containing protein n=1 Tax=Hoeflea sp. TaxID=1940281 RepID=UPI003A900C80
MPPEQRYQFDAELWLYAAARAPWHFITIPADVASQIRFMAGKTRGFGSIRVRARIGETSWATSLFPDKATGSYFLPVKADVRRRAAIAAGDRVSVELLIG